MFITHARLPQTVEAIVHKNFVLLIKCIVRPSDRQCGAKMIPGFFWQSGRLPDLAAVQFYPAICDSLPPALDAWLLSHSPAPHHPSVSLGKN
jgi:hypothetical protein